MTEKVYVSGGLGCGRKEERWRREKDWGDESLVLKIGL